MDDQLAEVSTAQPPGAQAPTGLTGHVARGFASTVVSTIIVKAVQFVAHIVLAYYLTETDFGLAAIAVSAAVFPSQIKELGITQLLLRHPKRFESWSGDAAWLTTVLGLLSGLTTVLMIPVVAWATDSPGVGGPLLLLALSAVVTAPATVSYVKLSIDLRFVFIARLNTAMAVASSVLSVLIAMQGFGPYAMVMPVVVVNALRMVLGLWLAPVRWTLLPRWSRCQVMLGDGWKMMLSLFFFQVVWQCDNLILGVFHTEQQVGIYFFAFYLSAQTLSMLSNNLASVLLPILGRMSGNQQRQNQGLIQACRYLCAIGLPLCFIQAAVGGPLLRVVWQDRWVSAIPAFQALSIGWAFRLIGLPSVSLLQAQGRLNAYLYFAIASAFSFVIVITIAAHVGAATTVAVAAALFYATMETGIAVIALGKTGVGPGGGPLSLSQGLRIVQSITRVPLLSAILGGTISYVLGEWTMRHYGPLPALVLGTAGGLIVSSSVLYILMPNLIRELVALVTGLVTRRGNR